MFGQLTKRVPNNEGGLYAYTRHEFGDFAGYLTAWCYWITCWAGQRGHRRRRGSSTSRSCSASTTRSAWINFGIALTGLWIPAVINLVGVRQMAVFQNITVVLKFLPLLFVGARRLVLRRAAPTSAPSTPRAAASTTPSTSPPAWPCSPSSASSAHRSPPAGSRTRGATSAGPRSSAPRPAALLYVAVTAVVMGLVPHGKLVDDGAPFVAAFDAMFNGGWLGKLVALTAVISGIGALNGWTMVTAEMPYAAAKDGLFLAVLRQGEPQQRPVGRRRRLDDRGLAADGVELQRRDRAQGVHLPRVPVGGHGGHPVLPLRLRPAHLPRVPPPGGAGLGAGP